MWVQRDPFSRGAVASRCCRSLSRNEMYEPFIRRSSLPGPASITIAEPSSKCFLFYVDRMAARLAQATSNTFIREHDGGGETGIMHWIAVVIKLLCEPSQTQLLRSQQHCTHQRTIDRLLDRHTANR